MIACHATTLTIWTRARTLPLDFSDHLHLIGILHDEFTGIATIGCTYAVRALVVRGATSAVNLMVWHYFTLGSHCRDFVIVFLQEIKKVWVNRFVELLIIIGGQKVWWKRIYEFLTIFYNVKVQGIFYPYFIWIWRKLRKCYYQKLKPMLFLEPVLQRFLTYIWHVLLYWPQHGHIETIRLVHILHKISAGSCSEFYLAADLIVVGRPLTMVTATRVETSGTWSGATCQAIVLRIVIVPVVILLENGVRGQWYAGVVHSQELLLLLGWWVEVLLLL